MRHFFLIARHEYIKYITRRGFIISLLLFPIWVGVAGVLPRLIQRTEPVSAFMVIDHEGGYDAAVAAALRRTKAVGTLAALARFAKTYDADFDALARAAPDVAAMLKAPERETSLEAYLGKGGLDPVFDALTPFLRKRWTQFNPPKPLFEMVPPSDELLSTQDFAKTSALYFDGKRGVGDGLKLAAILVIPKGYGARAAGPAQYWSDALGGNPVNYFLRATVTNELRVREVETAVPDMPSAAAAAKVTADIEEHDPTLAKKDVGERVVGRVLPFGFAFLLFIATFINANALLMGVIEEKSTRMVEILLSCASPREIMAGKLLGAIGASLTTILLWALGIYAVISVVAPHSVHGVLAGVGTFLSVENAPLVLLYFACGLLIYGALFLGIGSMAASVADAQALLGPASLIIFLPNIFASLIIADPNGFFARIISWIPIYTPYFMLMRLPSHPAQIELWATAGLTLLTTLFVMLQMAKVFANNVLTTERPPALGAFLRSLFKRAKPRRA